MTDRRAKFTCPCGMEWWHIQPYDPFYDNQWQWCSDDAAEPPDVNGDGGTIQKDPGDPCERPLRDKVDIANPDDFCGILLPAVEHCDDQEKISATTRALARAKEWIPESEFRQDQQAKGPRW